MADDRRLVHTTARGVEIFVEPGRKSRHDFRVRYREPSGRLRTPKHIHLIVELYVKQAYDNRLTIALRDHLLGVYEQIEPIDTFPPSLQVFEPAHLRRFQRLDAVGEFSVEFMLVVTELIFIQEKTNYPEGSLTQQLYTEFGMIDRFTVVTRASQTRYGGRR